MSNVFTVSAVLSYFRCAWVWGTLVLVGASLLNTLNTFHIENTLSVENTVCRTHKD
jgi:hypothetical protein